MVEHDIWLKKENGLQVEEESIFVPDNRINLKTFDPATIVEDELYYCNVYREVYLDLMAQEQLSILVSKVDKDEGYVDFLSNRVVISVVEHSARLGEHPVMAHDSD